MDAMGLGPSRLLFLATLALLLSDTTENVASSDKPPKLIVISFDGFRPDFVKPDTTPTLYQLGKSGVFGKHMKPQFGTKTYPNHMSIATGLYEEAHGVIHNHMYDPIFNATFDWFNTETRWWDNNVSLPIWVANQLENDGKVRYSGGMMWPGTSTNIHGQKPVHIGLYDHGAKWTKTMDTVISWFTDKDTPANCVFVYFDQPDSVGHIFGPFSKEYEAEVKRADAIIGYLIRKLHDTNLYDETNLIVLSDHGFAEIESDRLIELNKFVNRSRFDMYGTSPLWNLIPKAGFEDVVYEELLNASKHYNFSVYKKHEVPQQYHYSENRRILTLVVVADDGYDLIDDRTNLGEEQHNKVWGNHGYNNSAASMQPLFIAHGPAFQEGLVYNRSFENIDLYPLMCYVLQLLPISRFPSNGTLSRVSGMLRPVLRGAPSSNVMPILAIFMTGFAMICLGGTCIVFMAGCGKPKKNVELGWDAGVTEFDLGPHHDSDVRSKQPLPSSRTTFLPEEAVLLLDDNEDEL